MSNLPPPEPFPAATRRRIAVKLLAWFDRHRRDLPWRRDRDPYRIWVSEVMLQQTTVAAVVAYFDRFLVLFPTVAALAAAPERDVLHAWQGMGYYRRARALHAAAKRVVADHGGELRDDPGAWATLPGVGRYTLNAVLSQAFDRRLPVVEANTLRVLSRLFGSRLDPRSGAGQRWLWKAAESLLPRRRVGDFNQATMELGALVCTPQAPKCGACPMRSACRAYASGLQDVIPPPAAKRDLIAVREVGLFVRKESSVLLAKCRRDADRWAGLWTLPTAVLEADADLDAAAEALTRSLGITTSPAGDSLSLHYGVTRFRMTLTVLVADHAAGRPRGDRYAELHWVPVAALAEYPTGTAMRKALTELTHPDRTRPLF